MRYTGTRSQSHFIRTLINLTRQHTDRSTGRPIHTRRLYTYTYTAGGDGAVIVAGDRVRVNHARDRTDYQAVLARRRAQVADFAVLPDKEAQLPVELVRQELPQQRVGAGGLLVIRR